MPGHKGKPILGIESSDITEIVGADSLYDASGIIRKSEENASTVFGCRTFYSTEGSSHAIRAMLALVCQYAKQNKKTPLIWAGRNAHSAFLSAAALLDFQLKWLYSDDETHLSCTITASTLEEKFKTADTLPIALYVTSPDYLGNQIDINALAKVCHKHGVLLLADNAHGAYLKFLTKSMHPMDLGADICCDSAHKTLPVLTGGAYLHLSNNTNCFTNAEVKQSLRLFGSTSPSYLILQSLDKANSYLTEEYKAELSAFLPCVSAMKERLITGGYTLVGNEPLKITIKAKEYGYTGAEIAEILAKHNVIAEFFDPDYIVFMLTPCNEKDDTECLTNALLGIPRKKRIQTGEPTFYLPKAAMSVRDAMLAPFETVPVKCANGRILAGTSVSCPPAVSVLVSGEVIDQNAIDIFDYYGTKTCNVVKQ